MTDCIVGAIHESPVIKIKKEKIIMTQAFAAPVIQQPEKLKKHFCFATIPLIIIALSSLFFSVLVSKSIPSNWYELLGNEDYLCEIISDFMCLFHFTFFFISAVMLAILLFAKKNNFLLGLPLLMFSAGYLFMCGATVASAYGLTCGEEIIFDTFAAALWDNLPLILIYFSSSVAFFVVAVYTVIVTLRKKSVPRVLWIIPAILFCILFVPYMVNHLIYFLDMASVDILWALKWLINFVLYYPTYWLSPVAVILFLIWLSFPYKKEKSQKATQPAPQTAPVIPPSIPEVKPAYTPAKHEDADPERTLDYSYAEIFYPPVSKTAVKTEPEKKPSPVSKNDMEHQLNNIQLLTEYKKLLDNGVITQEDYDRKKNELLGF